MAKAPDNVGAHELNVVARQVLLDGLCALHRHLDAITVVGAQAVHLRTPEANITGGAFTSDGDLSIDPARLGPEPRLEELLRTADFELMYPDKAGLWARSEVVGGVPVRIELDLLVGASLGVAGRESARLPPHHKKVALKVAGLEVAVVDRSPMRIGSLHPGDDRSVVVNVAGPVALLVAKAFKITDRIAGSDRRPDRLTDKDAGDVLRIMMVTPVGQVAASFAVLLSNDRVGGVARDGLRMLRQLFEHPGAPGTRMAVSALAGDVPEQRVRALAPAYVRQLPPVP